MDMDVPRRRFGRRRRRRGARGPRPERRRAVYLLPNLITTGALMLGFWSMTRAFQGDYGTAAVAIILAAVLDTMDGRVARATHSTSRFGVQYDSLADLISFGVAPAILVHASALQSMGRRGWTIAALYAVCAALRLARFNVQSELGPRAHNYGLPSTIAGGVTAVGIWYASDLSLLPLDAVWLQLVPAVGTAVLALLMVSGVPYPSWKSLPTSGPYAFHALVVIVLITILVIMTGIRGFFAIGVLYVLSGPVLGLWLWLRPPDPGDDASVPAEPAEEPRPHVH